MSWQRGSTSVRQNQTHLLLWQIWVPARETQGDFSHHFSALCQYPAVKYSPYSCCENSCLESCTISVGTRVWCRHTNVRTVRKKNLPPDVEEVVWTMTERWQRSVFFHQTVAAVGAKMQLAFLSEKRDYSDQNATGSCKWCMSTHLIVLSEGDCVTAAGLLLVNNGSRFLNTLHHS